MEKTTIKRGVAAVLAVAMASSMVACTSAQSVDAKTPTAAAQPATTATAAPATTAPETAKAPKYVFMFIGDGMSYVQQQAASYYLGALEQDKTTVTNYKDESKHILTGGSDLSFMEFDNVATAVTFDSTSFAPDSASTATSLATGKKTFSGSINVDETGKIQYEAISEKAKDQLGYKVGVISSVNLNHATPAAYYGHNVTRNNYYDLGLEMIDSGFDYFSGGGLKKVTGAEGDQKDLYTVAEEAGYKVVKTQAEAEKVTAADGKVIIIDEHLADSDAMAYEIDRAEGDWALADHVAKGIECLDNDKGFFMMVEAGKIDWACHANDVAASIGDTIAFSNAIAEAVEFYNTHPEDTLIVVTGDHETGGLTIGAAGTKYDLFLKNLENQTISQSKFDADYVSKYVETKASFETVMADVQKLFGMVMPGKTAKADQLVLTDYEVEQIKAAYEITVMGNAATVCDQEKYETYGSYTPLAVTISHLMNNKAGIGYTSYSHTGVPVGVYAQGCGAETFEGQIDNTEVFDKIADLMQVK